MCTDEHVTCPQSGTPQHIQLQPSPPLHVPIFSFMLSPHHPTISSPHISSFCPSPCPLPCKSCLVSSCSQHLPPHFSHGLTPQKHTPSKPVSNAMRVELDIAEVVLEWICMLRDSHWDYSGFIHAFLYISLFLLCFSLLCCPCYCSSTLITFTIRPKFYHTPFTPAPTVVQQQPFIFTPSLFTSRSIFTYNTAQSVTSRT